MAERSARDGASHQWRPGVTVTLALRGLDASGERNAGEREYRCGESDENQECGALGHHCTKDKLDLRIRQRLTAIESDTGRGH